MDDSVYSLGEGQGTSVFTLMLVTDIELNTNKMKELLANYTTSFFTHVRVGIISMFDIILNGDTSGL